MSAIGGIVKDHYLLLAALTLVGAAMGLAYAAYVTPVFRATATIEVQDLNENFLNLKEVASASPISSVQTDLQTQLRILQSRTLVARVVQQVGGPGTRGRGEKPSPLPDAAPGEAPPAGLVEAASRGLQVRETRQSRIVDLVYESPDPTYAAAFVNQLARQYIDQSVESRLEISRGTSVWLDRQLQELRTKLAASERELQAYARDSGLLVTTETHRPDEEKLRQVQSNLSQAQENRMAKEARRNMAIKAPLESLDPPLSSALKEHRAKLADLRRQRADLIAVYTSEFGQVKRLDAQISDLEATVQRESLAVLQAINNDYVDAAGREQLVKQSYNDQVKQVTSTASKAIQYGILKNEVQSSRELYNTMLQRSAAAKVASALRASNARIVDPAIVPQAPFRPNRSLSVISGGTAGLLCGLVLAVRRERRGRRTRSSDDLASWAKLPELGSIPNNAAPAPELYRGILTSILVSPVASRTPQVIAITSTRPGEGKSTLVFRLAKTLSRLRRRVLVIDGARGSGLQELFGQVREYGLLDLAELSGEGREMLAYVTNPTRLSGVHFTSLGPDDTSVLDVFLAQGLDRLFVEMRRDYDTVLIDTPALTECADARVFAKMADGTVLVVQPGKAAEREIDEAVRRLQCDDSVVLGTVTNRA